METLNVLIHVLVAFVSFALGFWLALERLHEQATEELHTLFRTWEVEDKARDTQAQRWFDEVQEMWKRGQYEAAMQWAYIYAMRDKRLMVLYTHVRRTYTLHVERQRMEASVISVKRSVQALTAPVRDARGRFVKGNAYRFSRRTARA